MNKSVFHVETDIKQEESTRRFSGESGVKQSTIVGDIRIVLEVSIGWARGWFVAVRASPLNLVDGLLLDEVVKFMGCGEEAAMRA